MVWTIIGILAATLTTFSFIPQIARCLRIKSAKDVSPVMLFQLSTGVSLWMLYGAHLRDPIIILANGITLISLSVLIFLYFRYGLPANKEK